ncbi:MAG: hypothetical protein HUU38_02975 [Anaerolineales bacterium]|nr:hypothetical protein [Anaerolineales bacterium]
MTPKDSTTIRASEIGTYLYCQRAWSYQREGEPSTNQAEMLTGTELHAQHGRQVFTAGLLRTLAYGLILLALVMTTYYFLSLAFS